MSFVEVTFLPVSFASLPDCMGNRGPSLTSGNTSSGADEARADIDGVGVSGLHVDGREGRIGAKRRLAVEGRVGAGAAACFVTREEEGPLALVRERGGAQLLWTREEEL